jgi:hypothetical protein
LAFYIQHWLYWHGSRMQAFVSLARDDWLLVLKSERRWHERIWRPGLLETQLVTVIAFLRSLKRPEDPIHLDLNLVSHWASNYCYCCGLVDCQNGESQHRRGQTCLSSILELIVELKEVRLIKGLLLSRQSWASGAFVRLFLLLQH